MSEQRPRPTRGGRSGLRDLKRWLLYPVTQLRSELEQKPQLNSTEADLFHQLHRVLLFADSLGPRIADFPEAEDLVRGAGLSEAHCSLIFRPAEVSEASGSRDTGRSRSPRRPTGTELIEEQRVGDAASRLVEILGLGWEASQAGVCLFDFNGVLNLSWYDSVQVIKDLKSSGVKVGVLSYSRARDTIQSTAEYVRALGRETELLLPLVISPRPTSRDCLGAGDWCKADFLAELPGCNLAFIDDRRDIIQDCRRVVASRSFRAIVCDRGLLHAIGQWTVPKRGSHYLDFTDTRVIRICP